MNWLSPKENKKRKKCENTVHLRILKHVSTHYSEIRCELTKKGKRKEKKKNDEHTKSYTAVHEGTLGF